jgi:hypothetical protein
MIPQIISLNDRFNNGVLESNFQLSVIIGEVMRTIYRPSTRKTITDLLRLLKKLGEFQKNLPPKLKPNIIVRNDRKNANLYLRLNQIVIITIRPLVLSVFIGQQDMNNDSTEIKSCTNINILKHSIYTCLSRRSRARLQRLKKGIFDNASQET